jgi:uncharacterized protein (TIGR00255 family)
MIQSMTGYGRGEASGHLLAVTVECKSLNHRHLDLVIKLPRPLTALELDARRVVQRAVQRGRVEISAALTSAEGAAASAVEVNLPQAREYLAAAQRLGAETGLSGVPSLEWVLGQPGVLERQARAAAAAGEAETLLTQALGHALADLVARRQAEGRALAQELHRLRDMLAEQAEHVAELVPRVAAVRAARLRERIQALLGEIPVDEGRLAMEAAVLAERADVTEELARLRAHLEQFRALLEEGGSVGRTMDFLLQEMHREVSTLGAKSDDLAIAQAVIAAKATVEKLREQVQNVE